MAKVKINNIEYKITPHAKYRMKKRGVSVTDLVAALEDPKSIRKQSKRDGKPQRIGVIGTNKVTVIYEEDSKVIITVYNYKNEYYKAKGKHRRNKNRLDLKRRHGNRIKS